MSTYEGYPEVSPEERAQRTAQAAAKGWSIDEAGNVYDGDGNFIQGNWGKVPTADFGRWVREPVRKPWKDAGPPPVWTLPSGLELSVWGSAAIGGRELTAEDLDAAAALVRSREGRGFNEPDVQPEAPEWKGAWEGCRCGITFTVSEIDGRHICDVCGKTVYQRVILTTVPFGDPVPVPDEPHPITSPAAVDWATRRSPGPPCPVCGEHPTMIVSEDHPGGGTPWVQVSVGGAPMWQCSNDHRWAVEA